jgi:ABC-type transporter Mla subunit MlaD
MGGIDMKYWILALSLLVMGCGGGESDDAGEAVTEAVEQLEEAADSMNEALDKAAEVGDMLEEKKEEIDAAVDDADNN